RWEKQPAQSRALHPLPPDAAATDDRDAGGAHLYDRIWWHRDYLEAGVDSGLRGLSQQSPAKPADQPLKEPPNRRADVARPRQRHQLHVKHPPRAPTAKHAN